MYYSEIKNCDVANGIGCRVTIFVSGCRNHCKNCFQPETWNFCYGQPFTIETEDKIIEMLKPSYISGLTLLGGEPMEPENQIALLPFVRRVRELYPEKNIWCYTGYTLETIKQTEATEELISLLDIIVDGPFVEELKDPGLWFRGSSNQRIINVKETLRTGKVIELEYRDKVSIPWT